MVGVKNHLLMSILAQNCTGLKLFLQLLILFPCDCDCIIGFDRFKNIGIMPSFVVNGWQKVVVHRFTIQGITGSMSRCRGHYKSTSIPRTALVWNLFFLIFCVELILASMWIRYHYGNLWNFLWIFTEKNVTIYGTMVPYLLTTRNLGWQLLPCETFLTTQLQNW